MRTFNRRNHQIKIQFNDRRMRGRRFTDPIIWKYERKPLTITLLVFLSLLLLILWHIPL